jgi:DNA invertase Pin-like site-specific DNA recombinase
LYLRSSKDRSDVSIDAQRRELKKLATDRGCIVVQEYVDVVESAKDDLRPGFQQLLRDLKSADRSWGVLMMVDTSRLSRRRYAAQVFKHEAKKRGVEIVYSKLPDLDPITSVVLEAVFEAFDEVHSLLSKEKGLAGMAENVKQGYRAGGRAPRGYRLKPVDTGATREGLPVTKTVLEPSDDAYLVAKYLKARAAGQSRTATIVELGIRWTQTSLTGMEWNALQYAGHTVWNVHSEFQPGEGYRGGTKRRPRSDWVIQQDTHPALISTEEAEAILAQLSAGKRMMRRRTPASYLLTGILQTPDGQPWYGDGQVRYRTKPSTGRSRYVPKEKLEAAVLGKVLEDMESAAFVAQCVFR